MGGVNPFGLRQPIPVYLDESLKAFATVYPAGGSLNTSIAVPTERLFALVGERWVDLCTLPGEATTGPVMRFAFPGSSKSGASVSPKTLPAWMR